MSKFNKHVKVPVYQSSLANVFSQMTREEDAIHSGEPCCICNKGDGVLEPFRYGDVPGLEWIHPECQAMALEATRKLKARQARDKARAHEAVAVMR